MERAEPTPQRGKRMAGVLTWKRIEWGI